MFGTASSADTINISADYLTIQEGIDAAVDGDVVLVAPGTYVKNINFPGKAIIVQSSGVAELTVIDGNQAGTDVVFSSGEYENTVLDGFSVVNGNSDNSPHGGGICRDLEYH